MRMSERISREKLSSALRLGTPPAHRDADALRVEPLVHRLLLGLLGQTGGAGA